MCVCMLSNIFNWQMQLPTQKIDHCPVTKTDVHFNFNAVNQKEKVSNRSIKGLWIEMHTFHAAKYSNSPNAIRQLSVSEYDMRGVFFVMAQNFNRFWTVVRQNEFQNRQQFKCVSRSVKVILLESFSLLFFFLFSTSIIQIEIYRNLLLYYQRIVSVLFRLGPFVMYVKSISHLKMNFTLGIAKCVPSSGNPSISYDLVWLRLVFVWSSLTRGTQFGYLIVTAYWNNRIAFDCFVTAYRIKTECVTIYLIILILF